MSMSSQLQRNGDGILTDCLCFGACCFPYPSISLLLAMFAMHHHSLPLSVSSLLCLIISQRDGSDGWTSGYLRGETMETQHLLLLNTMKLLSATQRHHSFFLLCLLLILLLPLFLSPSLQLHPFYLCLHVIVCQPNLSNQQIRPK